MDNKIIIDYVIGQKTAQNLSHHFKGTLKSTSGEYEIIFDNDIGKGTIRVVTFGNGMSLLSFDVKFSSDVFFETLFKNPVPIDFLFLTAGSVHFTDGHKQIGTIENYQNVIIRYKSNSLSSFKMNGGEVVKLNIIQICPELYIGKHGKKVDGLPHHIKNVFLEDKASKIFHHFGNFNLKIADYIRQINNCSESGMIRHLMFEGNVNIILGLQLSEYEKYSEKSKFHESLNSDDILKIQKATDYLRDHVHENLSVRKLAFMVQLTPPNLQKVFKLLYQKTVNNYIKEIKLQAAYSYLESSNFTVSEVVYKVGYSSRSYFTQIFFERFGILPSAYIKNSK